MKRKLSRDERMGSQERRTAVLRLLSRMELLEAELRSCADAQRKEEIKSEMRVLRRDQTNLSVKKGKPKKHVVPLPQAYLEKRKETREAAARVSERHKIKAQFVQGGPRKGWSAQMILLDTKRNWLPIRGGVWLCQ